MGQTPSDLWPFVPRHHLALLARGHRSSVVDGTVLFADVSGFTALSERLERRGREGAELMSDLLGAIFGPMLDVATARGGDLLGYGGDALLLLFTGSDHARQATATAAELLAVLGHRTPAHRAAGRVTLTMSMGAESGPVALFAAGNGITQLIAAGPVVDEALRAEAEAQGGELLVGPALAGALRNTAPRGDGLHRVLQHPQLPVPRAIERRLDHESFAPVALTSNLSTHLAQEGRFGEHRPITALFVKHPLHVDPSSVGSRRRAARELDDLTSTIIALCDRHRLTLVAPDVLVGAVKFSIVAGAPVAHGDSVDASISFALDLLHSVGDQVSIGINRGTVFCGDIGGRDRRVYAVLGDAMNLAARVMARARPGEALIEAHTASAARIAPRLRAIEPFHAKGKTEPVHAFRISPGDSNSVDLHTELLGRDEELSILNTAWADALAGRASSVAVEAPPGLGKSSLLRAWLTQLEAPRTLEITGGRLGRFSPFFSLSIGLRQHLGLTGASDQDLLARLDELLAERAPRAARWRGLVALALGVDDPNAADEEVIDARLRTERLNDTLAALLAPAGAPDPLVVVVDDSQWLDDATESTLVYLTSRAPGVVVCVSAHRAGQPSALAGLADVQLDLGPLGEDVARRIVRSKAMAPLPVERIDDIIRRADGNPLFLAALATAGADRSLPVTVEEAVRAELDRLPSATRGILGDLAALGTVADRSLAVAVLGEERTRSLGSLGAEDFIAMSGADLIFTHPLRREVAYEAMPYQARRRAHRRALDHLLADPDPPSALVALHAWRSRAYEETWMWSQRAAAEPSARLSPASAAEHLEWAVQSGRHLRSIATADRAAVLDELGDTYERLGRFAEAERAFRTALSLDEDEARTVRRMCRIARQCEHQGHLGRGLRWARRASVGATQLGPEIRSLPARVTSSLQFRSGDLGASLDANQVAMEFAQAARDRAMLAQTYRQAGTIKELTGVSGVRDLRKAVKISTGLGDFQSAAWALNNLGAALYYRGDWVEASESYNSYREFAARIGDTLEAAVASNNLAEILSDQGHLAVAESHFAEALEVFDGAGYRIGRAVALGNLGRTHRRAGEAARAALEFDAAIAEFESIGADDFVADVRLRRVELYLSCGRLDDAADDLGAAQLGEHDSSDRIPRQVAAARLAAIVALQLGDREAAEVEIGKAIAIADDAHYRYAGALALEVAVLGGLDTSAKARRRLDAALDNLGIVDSGQRMLLVDAVI